MALVSKDELILWLDKKNVKRTKLRIVRLLACYIAKRAKKIVFMTMRRVFFRDQ